MRAHVHACERHRHLCLNSADVCRHASTSVTHSLCLQKDNSTHTAQGCLTGREKNPCRNIGRVPELIYAADLTSELCNPIKTTPSSLPFLGKNPLFYSRLSQDHKFTNDDGCFPQDSHLYLGIPHSLSNYPGEKTSSG